jgi:hypothetical protein
VPRPSIIRAIVLLAAFLAGALALLLADRLLGKALDTPTRVISAELGGVLIALVALILLISFDSRERARQIASLSTTIDSIARQFGLLVEFIPDHPGQEDGMSYERTRQLIARAEKNLVFVDFWVETGYYREGDEHVRQRRQSYYEEILSQIELRARHDVDGPPFHRRIVQLPKVIDPERGAGLSTDESFVDYLRQCLALQELAPRASVVKISQPHVHIHFVIIDMRYVVLPILTASPPGGGLRRYGALLFDDQAGDLVRRLMDIYGMLDAVAQPLEYRHL